MALGTGTCHGPGTRRDNHRHYAREVFLSPAPSWLALAAKSTVSFGQGDCLHITPLLAQLAKQPLPKSQAHFHTKGTTAASPKRPRTYFSSHNQPAKRTQNSTASRTEKIKQVLSTNSNSSEGLPEQHILKNSKSSQSPCKRQTPDSPCHLWL